MTDALDNGKQARWTVRCIDLSLRFSPDEYRLWQRHCSFVWRELGPAPEAQFVADGVLVARAGDDAIDGSFAGSCAHLGRIG